MKYSITKNGVDAKHLCDINEKTKTVSTVEDGLVFDFSVLNGWTFKTGSGCTFKAGSCCTFNTGCDCTFNAGYECTFNAGYGCTFKTGCDCTFNAGYECTFDTGSDCIFNTYSNCTFKTGSDCTFNTYSNCTFTTGDNCVVIRRDMFEVIQLKANETIKLNCYQTSGYAVVKQTKSITLELTEEQIESLKKQGIMG